MTDPVAIQAPIVEGSAVELAASSRIFRKQVLRPGTINYKGKPLEFTDAYLDSLVTAFGEKPYPMVPLVFADAQNRHTQDVERIRGEVIGLERTAEGLDAIVQASNDEAASLLRENPKIGCSVRIEQPLDRADGQSWSAALHHVLATANPVMPGLGDWASVELSTSDRTVIDLSTYDFADDGEDTAADTKEAEMPDTPSSQLTEDEVARMRAILAEYDTPADEAPEGTWTQPSDEQLEALAAQLLAEDEEPVADVADNEPVAVGLSREDNEALELANARADRLEIEMSRLRTERDTAAYEKLRDSLAVDYGIPPRVTDLAKALLTGSHVIEMSNGDEVDAGKVMHTVLTEIGKEIKLVELGRGPTAWDTNGQADADEADKSRRDDMATYRQTFGL